MTAPTLQKYGETPARSAYVINPLTGCWIWQGGTTYRGYGLMWDAEAGKMRTAHRVMYERHVGPVPEDKQIDHLCRTRLCCNPEHLEPVTAQTNTRRGAATKLSPENIVTIREAKRAGATTKALSERFGVCTNQILRIIKGTRWADVIGGAE